MMTLLKTSPAGSSNLPQNLTLEPMEHLLGVMSHQEAFDLGVFGSDDVLFGNFEGDAMYAHTFEESLFTGMISPCFLPSTATAPSGSTSPIDQLQLQYYDQQKEPHLQRRLHQQQDHQQYLQNNRLSQYQSDDHRQAEPLPKPSQNTLMVSPEPQPEYLNHPSSPYQPSQCPHIPLTLQQIPYPGSIHDLIEINPVRMEMLCHRAPMLERLSSPDGSLSPISDHSCFDSMTDDEPSSSSSHNSFTSLSSLADDRLASPLSRLKVACNTIIVGDPAPILLHRVRRAVPQLDCTHMSVDPSIASFSPMSSPTASTTPVLSSPLKQHFSSFSDSEGPEEDESQLQGKRRKRVRRPYVKKVTQLKPSIKIPCAFPGCSTQCSSQPSLARHAETHKWRGLYAPVRCEACQSALSNEFSVQRHIQRAPATSACRKMRVYSVMQSETQVQYTVRFYPKRPHGKKTVAVDLRAFQRRNLKK